MTEEGTDARDRAPAGDPAEHVVDLTSVEREALSRLPRKKPPSELLEGRVVRALRERGVLRDDRTDGLPERSETGRGRVPAWAAIAAGLVLFVVGAVGGHRLGTRGATDAFLAVREQDAALRVQEVGSAYVRSLMALEALRAQAGTDPSLSRGREVATTTLHAAARVMARLDPSDPLPPALVELLEERLFGPEPDPGSVRHTYAF